MGGWCTAVGAGVWGAAPYGGWCTAVGAGVWGAAPYGGWCTAVGAGVWGAAPYGGWCTAVGAGVWGAAPYGGWCTAVGAGVWGAAPYGGWCTAVGAGVWGAAPYGGWCTAVGVGLMRYVEELQSRHWHVACGIWRATWEDKERVGGTRRGQSVQRKCRTRPPPPHVRACQLRGGQHMRGKECDCFQHGSFGVERAAAAGPTTEGKTCRAALSLPSATRHDPPPMVPRPRALTANTQTSRAPTGCSRAPCLTRAAGRARWVPAPCRMRGTFARHAARGTSSTSVKCCNTVYAVSCCAATCLGVESRQCFGVQSLPPRT